MRVTRAQVLAARAIIALRDDNTEIRPGVWKIADAHIAGDYRPRHGVTFIISLDEAA